MVESMLYCGWDVIQDVRDVGSDVVCLEGVWLTGEVCGEFA